MRKKKVSVLLFLLLLVLYPLSFCSATYTITTEQLQTLEMNLQILEQNNERLAVMQIESEKDLHEVKTLLKKSEMLIKELQQELEQSEQEVQKLKQSSKKTEQSLQKAVEYLNVYERKQNKLEMQNRLLKYSLIVLGTYAVVRK